METPQNLLKSLTVENLRAELTRRGLDTTGRKSLLITRLADYYQSQDDEEDEEDDDLELCDDVVDTSHGNHDLPPELEDILKDETDDMEIWCDDDSSDEEAVEVKQEASSDDYPVQKTVQTSIDEPEQMQEVYLTTTKTEDIEEEEEEEEVEDDTLQAEEEPEPLIGDDVEEEIEEDDSIKGDDVVLEEESEEDDSIKDIVDLRFMLRVNHQGIIAELSAARRRKTLIVYPITYKDLGEDFIMDILSQCMTYSTRSTPTSITKAKGCYLEMTFKFYEDCVTARTTFKEWKPSVIVRIGEIETVSNPGYFLKDMACDTSRMVRSGVRFACLIGTPPSVTSQQVLDILPGLSAVIGITDTGKPSGLCYVEFENKIDARDAVHNAQSNLVLDGHRMYAFVLSDISAGKAHSKKYILEHSTESMKLRKNLMNRWEKGSLLELHAMVKKIIEADKILTDEAERRMAAYIPYPNIYLSYMAEAMASDLGQHPHEIRKVGVSSGTDLEQMIMKKNDYETLLFEQKHGIQTDEVQIDDQLDQDAQSLTEENLRLLDMKKEIRKKLTENNKARYTKQRGGKRDGPDRKHNFNSMPKKKHAQAFGNDKRTVQYHKGGRERPSRITNVDAWTPRSSATSKTTMHMLKQLSDNLNLRKGLTGGDGQDRFNSQDITYRSTKFNSGNRSGMSDFGRNDTQFRGSSGSGNIGQSSGRMGQGSGRMGQGSGSGYQQQYRNFTHNNYSSGNY